MKSLLENHERQQLEAAYKSASDKRTASNINILLLLDDGYPYSEVAAILRLNDSTVRRHESEFKINGLEEYIKNPFTGGTCKLEADQLQILEHYLDDNLCETTDEIIRFVEERFGITYARSGMAALLRRLGFVFKRPTVVPGKYDLEMQAAFIDYFNSLRESMGEDDKLYFLDGVHPQHNSQAGHGWIRKGEKRELKSNTGRKRVNLNGALDVDTHEVIIREDDTLNAESAINLFKMIESQNPNANKIALVVDNAPYYFNGDVLGYINDSSKLKLIYLPPYSPNLNLIERVWGFMKRKVIYNTYHETFADFKAAIGDFFQNLPKYDSELESLLVEEFQILGV
jgi:transposase